VRRLRKRLLRDLESVHRNLEDRTDLAPSRRLMGEEVLGLIADDLAALEQAASVCERRIMEQEKVPVAEKIISLSDSDASFIVKGGWNTVAGYRPQLARSGRGFVNALVLPRGNAADSPHLATMVKEQITNTGVIPSMASADDGYSTQQGLEEVLGLGLKVVSISGAKGKKLIEAQKWKSQPYRQARVAYNISQIIRVRKKRGRRQDHRAHKRTSRSQSALHGGGGHSGRPGYARAIFAGANSTFRCPEPAAEGHGGTPCRANRHRVRSGLTRCAVILAKTCVRSNRAWLMCSRRERSLSPPIR